MEYLSFEPPLRRTNRGEIVRTDLASPPRATSLPLSPIIAHFSLSLSHEVAETQGASRFGRRCERRSSSIAANRPPGNDNFARKEGGNLSWRPLPTPDSRNCARRRTSSFSSFLQIQDLLLRESGGSIVVFRIKI